MIVWVLLTSQKATLLFSLEDGASMFSTLPQLIINKLWAREWDLYRYAFFHIWWSFALHLWMAPWAVQTLIGGSVPEPMQWFLWINHACFLIQCCPAGHKITGIQFSFQTFIHYTISDSFDIMYCRWWDILYFILLVSFPIMLLISIYPNLLPVKYTILLQRFSLSNTNVLQHFAVPVSTFLRHLAAIKLKTSSFEIYIF